MPDTGLEHTRLRDILVTGLYAAVVAILLRVFVIGAYEIPSHSMENTLLSGDFIVVSKLAYLWSDVHRGDIVIFRHHDSIAQFNNQLFVKRVVAVPGDTVRLTEDAIIVNGVPLPTPPEAKIPTSPLPLTVPTRGPIIVGLDSVYVVGDNRRNSYDSRYWGSVAIEDLKGSPLFIYWSHGPSESNPLPHIRWDRIFNGIY
ncbi:MAG: signal peptidase I [Ignavibacteria bacterium]|nr:signal peptidase I [Ignavibacteria bacterium]